MIVCRNIEVMSNKELSLILGWYLVWKLFLSRFRLVRELLGLRNDSTTQRSDEVQTNKLNKPRKVRRD